MATRPPREPRGSRVMLRRCIFLISTSENFVSRYVSSSGLARHIGGVGHLAGHEATVLPSYKYAFCYTDWTRRANHSSACKKYFIVKRRLSNKARAIHWILYKSERGTVERRNGEKTWRFSRDRCYRDFMSRITLHVRRFTVSGLISFGNFISRYVFSAWPVILDASVSWLDQKTNT